MVSVIIPVFNREATLERAVQSVLAQTWKDLEVIIVDDASTDATAQHMRRMEALSPKVTCLFHEERHGANYCRNAGITAAKGEYIAFQDSDDFWHAQKLEKQLRAMEANCADFVFCSVRRRNIPQQKEYIFPKFKFDPQQSSVYQFLRSCMAMTPSILLKRCCFETVALREDMLRFQEWDFVIQIARHFTIAFVDEVLVDAYVLDDSVSNDDRLGYEYIRKLYELNKDLVDDYPDVREDYFSRMETYRKRIEAREQ